MSSDAAFSSPYTGSETSGTSNTWSPFPNYGATWWWRVRAGNATGWSAWSSARSFVNGTASVPAPSISRISPNPAPGSWNKTTVTIYGASFQSGATVTWRDVTHGTTYANRIPESVSSNVITITPVFGPYAATWSAKVVSPDGKSSNEVTFSVYVAK
jgi:hypothetical protein